MARTLRVLVWTMGLACALIGLYHFTLGIVSVPGEGSARGLLRATVDSRERFYNAIFVGYGLAWVYAARQRPIPSALVRALAAVFLLSGAGRVASVLVEGWPHWFQVPLAALELVLPFVFWWLAPAEERVAGLTPAAGAAVAR